MEALRTPEERFANLLDFDFAPHYVELDDFEGGALRMHYLDEGPADGPVVLLLEGEPAWCYAHRKTIPLMSAAGLRCIAPDMIGFGRSDKPAKRTDYTYERHVGWIVRLIEQLDLTDITLFGRDWGGLVGLRVAAENVARFARILASNTFLPTGDQPLSDAFFKWRDHSQTVVVFDISRAIDKGTVSDLPAEVRVAYDAPFPDESFKEGARQFPMLVPATSDDPATQANRAAWDVLSKWDKPFLTVFGDSDPITRGADLFMQAAIPGAQGQPHVVIEGGGHFLQEDAPEQVAEAIIGLVKSAGS